MDPNIIVGIIASIVGIGFVALLVASSIKDIKAHNRYMVQLQ